MKAKKPVRRPKRSPFSRRLEELRLDCGHETQASFAKRLGIEGERYRRWERGEAEPNIEMLVQISMLTGASLNILLIGIDPVYKETEQKNLIRHKLR